jgi:hypothetical protein
MRLTEDYIHAFRGPSGVRSACRVRLYMPDEEDEALANNPGTSVTNAIEQIAAEVMDALTPTRVPVFVEHYPLEATGGSEETFDLVVFAHEEIREVLRGGIRWKALGSPTWKPLDRRAVEVLVACPA